MITYCEPVYMLVITNVKLETDALMKITFFIKLAEYFISRNIFSDFLSHALTCAYVCNTHQSTTRMHESDNIHLLTKFSRSIITDKNVLCWGNKSVKNSFGDKC